MDEQQICDKWIQWALDAGMYENNGIWFQAKIEAWTHCTATPHAPWPTDPNAVVGPPP